MLPNLLALTNDERALRKQRKFGMGRRRLGKGAWLTPKNPHFHRMGIIPDLVVLGQRVWTYRGAPAEIEFGAF